MFFNFIDELRAAGIKASFKEPCSKRSTRT